MENPRPEKVAVVDEIRQRIEDSNATVLTEYRGLDVAALQALRRTLSEAGADYKVYKNTLARFAASDAGVDLEPHLTGPTAFAFTATKADGTPGDAVNMAKALKEFARTNESLVIKAGLMDGAVLTSEDILALAELAPREELLARFAGLLAAPMQRFAGLLSAVPRDFAYGLQALIDQMGGVPEGAAEEGGSPSAEPGAGDDPEPTEPESDEPAVEATDDAEATAEVPQSDGGDDAAETESEEE